MFSLEVTTDNHSGRNPNSHNRTQSRLAALPGLAKADERVVAQHFLEAIPARRAGGGHRQILIGDKNDYGRLFEADLADAGIDLLRPARKGEKPRPGTQFFKPLRQVIESIDDTLKGQLDLEQHGGRTPLGVG